MTDTNAKAISAYKRELGYYELVALHTILCRWLGTPHDREVRQGRWKHIVVAFRSASGAGLAKGGKEAWPRELVADEYDALLPVVEVVFKKLKIARNKPQTLARLRHKCFRFPIDGLNVQVGRGCPREISADHYRETASTLTRDVVAQRLRVSEKTVYNVRTTIKKKGRRYETTDGQRYLASTFLELCSFNEPKLNTLCPLILNALFISGYDVLGMYYLIQRAHFVGPKLVSPPPLAEDVRSVCELITHGARQCGPYPEESHGKAYHLD